MKTVFFLTRWYPSKNDKMLGLFVQKHAKAAVKAGYNVVVLFVQPSNKKNNKVCFNKVYDVNELHLNYLSKGNIFDFFRYITSYYKLFLFAKRKFGKPDLLHAHILTRVAALAYYFSTIWTAPFIITEHWSRYYPENFTFTGFFRLIVAKFVAKKAYCVTTVSDKLSQAMRDCGIKANYKTLYNVIETEFFNPNTLFVKENKIISISCFDEKAKNIKLLIDAFELLVNAGVDVNLSLVGDGNDLLTIKKYVSDNKNINNKVHFKGLLYDDDLYYELQTSSCLALSSNYETFSIVVYEALSSGVPIVATDVADLKQNISNDFGIIVPTNNKELFAQALKEILSKNGDFDKERMHNFIENNFSYTAISRKMNELYEGAVEAYIKK